MPAAPFKDYCSAVCSLVRWKGYRKAISAELTAHLEDHADALMALGLPTEEAQAQAVAAMGDPYVVGKELDTLHSPWWPRLSRVFTVLALLCLALILGRGNGFPVYDYAPFASPQRLLQEQLEGDTVLALGTARGGGSLGAYTFSGDGAAALYPRGDGYCLTILVPGYTPFFWLDALHLDSFPARLNSAETDRPFSGPLAERGVFRQTYYLTFPVEAPFAESYLIEVGERGELRYTVRIEEVAAP